MTQIAEKPRIPSLEIRLFGGFDVRVDGKPLPPLRSRREQWLLALLVLRQDRDTAREWLATLLWPDNDEPQALFYLRKSLSNLRQALGAEANRLQAPAPRTLRLDLTGAFVDVVAFDRARKRASGSADPTAALEEAIALYRGPLLPDCPEEWVTVERNRREQDYLAALEALATHRHAQGDPAAAVRWLRLLVSADPYRESACGALMQALADCGDQAAVTAAYQELRSRLRQDLNAAPAPQIDALYRQLRQQERPTAALPPPSPDAPATRRHLPVPLSDMIGRESEIAEILGWMRRRRLVTLVGSGGIGKTRLAIAAAEAALPRFDDGVWFVDLAPLSDPALAPHAIAKALGLVEQQGRSLIETLAEALASRSLLLVLDNCEHLPEACAELAHALLSACPALCMVATSRQALNVMGEQVYRVPSLSAPADDVLQPDAASAALEKDPHALMEYEAVRLFVERATRVDSAFRLTRRAASAVVEICRQLDGIPLAIEMAAARLRSLSVGEIQSRLADRFHLLTSGNRGVLPRQQTLRAAIDWSYDQLSETERGLLGRLSVFAGGWTGEEAEMVAGEAEDGSASSRPFAVSDTLASLADKSLVLRRAEDEEAVRYGMLETIRQYALERLEESGERAGIRRRHRDYFLTLAETIRPNLTGPEEARWLSVLDSESDNLRQALAFCREEPGGALKGLRLAVALQRRWQVRGHLREGREQYAALLALPIPQEASGVRADALNGAGVMAALQGDRAGARSLMEESLAIKRALGDRQGISHALNNLGNIAADQADHASARALYQESLAIRRELGDRRGIAHTLGSLASMAHSQADYASARSLYEESLTTLKELGDRQGIAIVLNGLGNIVTEQADYATARALYQESLTLRRELGDRRGIAKALSNLGNMAYYQIDYSLARSLYQESLAILKELGDRPGIAVALDSLGNVADNEGDPASARALYQESLTIKRELEDRQGIAVALDNLGIVASRQDDYPLAHSLYQESLTIKRELEDRRGIAYSFELFAYLAHQQERGKRAARLWGAVSALREGIGSPLPPARRREMEEKAEAAREAMGEEAFEIAWEEGSAMPMEQAIEYALA